MKPAHLNFRTLVLRSLAFHWRSHATVLFGISVAASVLTGALLVGDSVRGTLRDRALLRLAGAWFALAPTQGRSRLGWRVHSWRIRTLRADINRPA